VVRIGETFIYGRSKDRARRLLEACERVGVDRKLVRSTDDGYVVPNVVAEELEAMDVPAWSEDRAVF
jgi:hypothetical protein